MMWPSPGGDDTTPVMNTFYQVFQGCLHNVQNMSVGSSEGFIARSSEQVKNPTPPPAARALPLAFPAPLPLVLHMEYWCQLKLPSRNECRLFKWTNMSARYANLQSRCNHAYNLTVWRFHPESSWNTNRVRTFSSKGQEASLLKRACL